MEWLLSDPAEGFVISCGRAAVAVLSCGQSSAPRLGDAGAGPGQHSRSEVGEVDAEVTSL